MTLWVVLCYLGRVELMNLACALHMYNSVVR